MKKIPSLKIGFYIILSSLACISQRTAAQTSAIDIYEDLLTWSNPLTVMYVAAHPDDENTRLISWLSNKKHVRTVYLSLTRGDGGQNLIGDEKGQLLGLLRTQELLAARSIDGGEQTFSRANDFGYSKTATETRTIWEEDQIISDVVWAIRKYQPDVIINRFDHESNGKTHGHHTFSAIASMEAFDLAGDPNEFPNQLQHVDVWQPTRIFHNTSWWFYGSRKAFEEADKSNMVSVDVGSYLPLRGESTNEIASRSRSMHRCQGFGSSIQRGSQTEYLKYLKGQAPEKIDGKIQDIFSQLSTSWSERTGLPNIDEKIAQVIDAFDIMNPAASLEDFWKIRSLLTSIGQNQFVQQKLKKLEEIILASAALFVETSSSVEQVTPGDHLIVDVNAVNRGSVHASIEEVRYLPSDEFSTLRQTPLSYNQLVQHKDTIQIPEDAVFSTPYWLQSKPRSNGMYVVDDQSKIGEPENRALCHTQIKLNLDGHLITMDIPIQYKFTDPASGEHLLPLVISPPVTTEFSTSSLLLVNTREQEVKVKIEAEQDGVEGDLRIDVPQGWTSTPSSVSVSLDERGSSRWVSFYLSSNDDVKSGMITPVFHISGQDFSLKKNVVDYQHIPKQTVYLDASIPLQTLTIEVPDIAVGYVTGAGDQIPQALEQIGIHVVELSPRQLTEEQLNKFDAVMVGIRAFNMHAALSIGAKELWKYVERGGLAIVQYQTHRRLKTDTGPYPMTISRNRITVEEAELTMTDPGHPVFNIPNKITSQDFDYWVQERGLYFPSEWDDKYVSLIEGHDPGEKYSWWCTACGTAWSGPLCLYRAVILQTTTCGSARCFQIIRQYVVSQPDF